MGRHQPAEENGRWRCLDRFVEGSAPFKAIAPTGPLQIKLSAHQTRQGKQGPLEGIPYSYERPASCVAFIRIHKIGLRYFQPAVCQGYVNALLTLKRCCQLDPICLCR